MIRVADEEALAICEKTSEYANVRDTVLGPALAKGDSWVTMDYTFPTTAPMKPQVALVIGAVGGLIVGGIAGRVYSLSVGAKSEAP